MRNLGLAMAGLMAVRAAVAGGLDTSFGAGGFVMFNLKGAASTQVHSAILQADGKIVAVGATPAVPHDGDPVLAGAFVDATRDFLIVRFNPDGTLDSSFGSQGAVKIDFSGDDDRATGVVEQPDGKLVVVGSSKTINGDFDYAAARLDPDGSLDATFGIGGKFTLNQPASESEGPNGLTIINIPFPNNFGEGVALQPDGRVVIAGLLPAAAPGQPPGQTFIANTQVFRLTTDGQFDPTFNPTKGGFAEVGDPFFSAILSLPNGEVIVVTEGTLLLSAEGVALTPSYIPIQPSYGEINTACMESDGTPLLGGALFPAAQNAFGYQMSSTVMHLDAALKLDSSFGMQGAVTGFAGTQSNAVTGMTTEPDGNIITVGPAAIDSNATGRQVAVIARLRRNGALDTDFLTGGTQRIDFDTEASGLSFIPTTALRTPDGKILIIGNKGILSADEPAENYIAGTTSIAIARVISTPTYAPISETVSVSESAGQGTVQIARSGATSGPVSLDYATADGTALAGTDYTSASGTLTWQPGDPDTKSISIPIKDTHQSGTTGQFTLRLSNPTEGTILSAVATVSIAKDDVAPPPSKSTASSSGSGGGGGLDWLTCMGIGAAALARWRRRGPRCYE